MKPLNTIVCTAILIGTLICLLVWNYALVTAGSTQHDVYWRNAQIINVVDGDTVDAFIDLGYQTFTQQRMRLLDVDTPELRSSDPEERRRAQEARSYVVEWVAANCTGSRFPAQIRSEKDDSFGRYLAHVECSGRSLNQDLLDTGHAVRYE